MMMANGGQCGSITPSLVGWHTNQVRGRAGVRERFEAIKGARISTWHFRVTSIPVDYSELLCSKRLQAHQNQVQATISDRP
jgi:hypothetical protein